MEAPADGIEDFYLDTLHLSTYEQINLYNKAIYGIPDSYRCYLTRSKWTGFYQKLEDAVSKFVFKSAVLIVTTRDAGHAPTEANNIFLSLPSITSIILNSHCKILWADNYGADLGHHPTETYTAGLDDADKQAIIAQQSLRSKILGLYIKNPLVTNSKLKLRYFKSAYTFNAQYDSGAIIFYILKIV